MRFFYENTVSTPSTNEFVHPWPGSDPSFQSDEVLEASVLPRRPSPVRAVGPLNESSMPCRSRAEAPLSSLCVHGGFWKGRAERGGNEKKSSHKEEAKIVPP